MALQTKVYLTHAEGVPGAKATPDQGIYTPINYGVLDEAGIAAGGFAFRSDTDGMATATGGTADTLLGFVERVVVNPIYDVTEEGTLVVPQYGTLTIAAKGDFYAAAPATVAVGDSVTCDETGAIVSGGAIDTGYKYKTAGDEGDIVIISNWA